MNLTYRLALDKPRLRDGTERRSSAPGGSAQRMPTVWKSNVLIVINPGRRKCLTCHQGCRRFGPVSTEDAAMKAAVFVN